MARIIERGAQQWKNYHESVNHRVAQQCEVRFDTPQGQPVATLVQIASATAQMLGRSRLAGHTVNPMGSAWSFTDLVAGDGCILGVRVNDGGPCSDDGLVWSVSPEQARFPNPECLALVWGGTRIGQLNRALAARGRSIRTSGSHDGQTVAGAVGTGVSRWRAPGRWLSEPCPRAAHRGRAGRILVAGTPQPAGHGGWLCPAAGRTAAA